MNLENLKGCLVEVFYRDKPVTAWVKEVKGKRLHLLLPTGKEELINYHALISISSEKILNLNLNYLEGLLKERQEKRERLKEIFDLKELWEVVVEEMSQASSWELVELYLGKKSDSDEVAGFLRKVLEDRIYFSFEGADLLKVRSREEVENLLLQREKELARLKLLNEGELFLQILSGKAEQTLLSEERKAFWVTCLKQYVLEENAQGDAQKVVKELLQRHNLQEPLKVVELLVKSSLVEEDWFFELEKMRFPETFSEEEMQETKEILERSLSLEGRRDLQNLPTFTIDAEETEDFDDALSVLFEEDKILLYVHIADVSFYVRPSSKLWEGAFERASTLYLPERIIPMFPFELSHEKFSLKAGEDRLALTFKFEFSKDAELLSFQIFPSLIRVKERLTYKEVDTYLEKKEAFWKKLYELLMKQKEKRLKQGAFAVILPEIQVRVHPDGEITLERIIMTPARDLISEAMILANYHASKFLIEHQIPAIFRSQKEPFQVFEERESSLFYQILQLKFMAKSELSIEPDYHSGLGLSSYTTTTSPIRRALDLLIQYQLRAYLMGEPFLSKETLLKVLPVLQNNLQRAQVLQARRKRYFLLKYLKKYKMDEEMKGLIMEIQAKKAKIYLPEYNLTGEAFLGRGNFQPGTEVTVKPEKIDLLQELLRLKII